MLCNKRGTTSNKNRPIHYIPTSERGRSELDLHLKYIFFKKNPLKTLICNIKMQQKKKKKTMRYLILSSPIIFSCRGGEGGKRGERAAAGGSLHSSFSVPLLRVPSQDKRTPSQPRKWADIGGKVRQLPYFLCSRFFLGILLSTFVSNLFVSITFIQEGV